MSEVSQVYQYARLGQNRAYPEGGHAPSAIKNSGPWLFFTAGVEQTIACPRYLLNVVVQEPLIKRLV